MIPVHVPGAKLKSSLLNSQRPSSTRAPSPIASTTTFASGGAGGMIKSITNSSSGAASPATRSYASNRDCCFVPLPFTPARTNSSSCLRNTCRRRS